MALYKCCVVDCDSTSNTHKLFCMPVNDNLRNLWMSFLVPTNPTLLGLTKNQLSKKRVCVKHFDETQFDQAGVRIRNSYPCLFTQMEILHGVPLTTEEYKVEKEHNYCQVQMQVDNPTPIDISTVAGMHGHTVFSDHHYSLPSTSETTITTKYQSEGNVSFQDHQSLLFSTNQTPQISEMQGGASLNVHNENNAHNIRQHRSDCYAKTGKSTNVFITKTRRYIRKCTDLAKKSLGDTSGQRLQNAQQFSENFSIMKDFDKLNKRAKAFLIMQLRLATKNVMARRFSLDDKLFALALWKQSPKGYKLLENMFALPNKRTLARLSQRIIFECGINKNIFDHIKVITKGWDVNKKLCSLVFDEVALTPRLIYNENRDKINGFVEIEERKQKFADHALVLMIRGICSSWRQSIAYYFCSGTISATELHNILREIIPQLYHSGLVPLAIVCDQGSTFRSCFKIIKENTARLRSTQGRDGDITIHLAGYDLFLFYDPPHLLKGVRNNFMEKDVIFQQKRASWKDILYVYDLDNKSGHTRALPKLTAEHVDPKKIKKMKVKAAAQVLSARTAAMLNYTHTVHSALNNCLDTMQTTAAVVLFFDELFDSVNGSPGGAKGKLRCAVKKNTPHQDFWRKAILELKNIQFIDDKSKLSVQSGRPRHVRVPSLEGWIVTLESFLGLAKLLFSKFGVEYFYPRFINQDPLENFFGRIRAINYRNVNPDVNTFVYAFKSLVLSNILSPHSKFSNCEEDDGETLLDLNYLFIETTHGTQDENVSPNNSILPSSSTTRSNNVNISSENVIDEKVRVHISAYTAGYICRKITKKK